MDADAGTVTENGNDPGNDNGSGIDKDTDIDKHSRDVDDNDSQKRIDNEHVTTENANGTDGKHNNKFNDMHKDGDNECDKYA